MPVRFPVPDLPPLEIPIPDGPTQQVLKTWQERFERWEQAFGAILFRNNKQIEELSTAVYAGFTGAPQSLTSASAVISGCQTTINVLAGGVIKITAFADLQVSPSAVAAHVQLYSKAPNASAFTISADTTREIYYGPSAGQDRATVGQVWFIPNPRQGPWAFQLQGKKGTSGATTAIADANCSILVEVS